jgi:similar to stage IV sporulation protein
LTLRIANYMNGVVRVRICGPVPEKFINLCLARGIFLWSITKHNDDVLAYIRLPDFFRIRPLVRKSQSRIEVIAYHGFPFALKRLKRRKMLAVGAIVFFVLLHVLTSYIWFVDVTGQNHFSGEQIKMIARANGLKPGASKDHVDVRGIENQILLQAPEIAWVGVTLTGTRAVIEVVEKTLPKQEDKSPADIVATKPGIITEIIAIAGQSVVKQGDTVKKGDLLIKGVLAAPPAQQPPLPGQPPAAVASPALLRANGIIKARVWYESYGEAAVVQVDWERTGRQTTGIGLAIKEHHFTLKPVPAQPYEHFQTEVIHKKLSGWRNSDFVVEFNINVFYEVVSKSQRISWDEARDLAKGKALQMVQELIPENAQVLARGIETLNTAEPGLVRVKVSVETTEDIGRTANVTQ